MAYIKLEEAIEKIDNLKCECDAHFYGEALTDAKSELLAMHTADVVEVKHGYWIWDINAIDWGIGAWVCSECHAINSNIPQKPTYRPLLWTGSKYCPNCGAKMDGGAKNAL